MATSEITAAITGHPWSALAYLAMLILYLVWLRIRNRVEIDCQRDWDRALRDAGVPEDKRHKLFIDAARRARRPHDRTFWNFLSIRMKGDDKR